MIDYDELYDGVVSYTPEQAYFVANVVKYNDYIKGALFSDSGLFNAVTPYGDVNGVLLRRNKSFSSPDINPTFDKGIKFGFQAIAQYWHRRMHAAITSTMVGVTGSIGARIDVDDLDDNVFFDAAKANGFVPCAVAMHSKTYHKINNEGRIALVDDVPYFLGLSVIQSDGLPKAGDVYTTFILGEGAFGFAETKPRKPVALDRYTPDGEEKSVDYLITRRDMVIHPFGMDWTDANRKGDTPTNKELEDPANWKRTGDVKIAAITHTI